MSCKMHLERAGGREGRRARESGRWRQNQRESRKRGGREWETEGTEKERARKRKRRRSKRERGRAGDRVHVCDERDTVRKERGWRER